MDNTYCIVIGEPGRDPIAVAGPFASEEEAEAERRHYPKAYLDILIHPTNLQEARGDAHASGSN